MISIQSQMLFDGMYCRFSEVHYGMAMFFVNNAVTCC